MREVITKRIGQAFIFALLCLVAQSPARSQQIGDPARLSELRRLHDQLQRSNALREADMLVVMNERILAAAARQLVGLEIALSNSSTIRLTSVEIELKTAAAIVKFGLQTKSSVTVNLQLLGRINSGELEKDALRLPINITDVKLANGFFSSVLIKTIFGEWLKPEKWNNELPAIELPLEIAEMLKIPASRFETAGEMPMEISTPAFEAPMKFAITSLLVLNKRAVLAMQMDRPPVSAIQTSHASANNNDPIALENEIENLSRPLSCNGDLRIRLGRRVISQILTQIAQAQTTDFDIRLKHGRLRAEEVTAIVKITNYTDIESGQGRADITQLSIDQIADGKIHLKLSGQGELDPRLRGREYGIPYSLSPHVSFAIKDQVVPLQFTNDDKGSFLRAVAGATFPINLRISTSVAGRDLGINRTIAVQADRWLNRIDLPSFFGREIQLPRRMEVDAGGNLYITQNLKLAYTLNNLRLSASEDALDIGADVKLSTP